MTEATKTITFNTGRKYTAAGQPITATLHPDGTVTFFDHGRMIDGEITTLTAEEFSARNVLREYDAGRYRGSARSWADGMTRDGCNRRETTEKEA